MRTPDTYNWKVSWAHRSETVQSTSKFGAKQTARREFNIPAGNTVSVTKLGRVDAKV